MDRGSETLMNNFLTNPPSLVSFYLFLSFDFLFSKEGRDVYLVIFLGDWGFRRHTDDKTDPCLSGPCVLDKGLEPDSYVPE